MPGGVEGIGRVALVHDWLVTRGGAERVLEALVELLGYPPIYTLLHRPEAFVGSPIACCRIHTSWLQRLPGATRHHPWLLPLMPSAVEQWDLSAYDVVVSSSHAVAKGVLTRSGQVHVSYVHTPVRYAWDLYPQYMASPSLTKGPGASVRRLVAAGVLHYLRLWDLASAARPDVLVANSHHVARRIWKTYRRKARVIYPPVDVSRFQAPQGTAGRRGSNDRAYYVTHGRLVDYKRVDLIVRALTEIGRPLLVIGDGPERRRLEAMAGPQVHFAGWLDDAAVVERLRGARAYVFAAEEDFGMAPVEAQAAGLPVIAFGRGGASETVIDGQTGVLFFEQSVPALVDAVRRFEAGEAAFEASRIAGHARQFAGERFEREFAALLRAAVSGANRRRRPV
ncbi:glycosyltransferase [Carboxydochorda subterranea]|uniref:Glycosyltransferase n=1 Tax=Carboxydichorda subterranea TaxID=3109565 RepID=A0ABZ1C1C6_9FIRM|nr:glycosyltransferase [Limnochorda sp. L945t]WRP18665.1 glycosyltransferase [Limnochorda sp. L945t]